MTNIIKTVPIVIALCFSSACQQSDSLKLISQEEIIYNNENGFSTCFVESIFVGSKTTTYCPETRAYGVGINNKNDNRFNASSYTLPINNSGSLEGKWMLLYDNPDYGWVRQSCLINEIPSGLNMYKVDCDEMPNNPSYLNADSILSHDTTTNTVSFYYSSTPSTHPESQEDPYNIVINVGGTESNMNYLHISGQRIHEYPDENVVAQELFKPFSLVRLGDTSHTLGEISIDRFDHENNLVFSDQYTVANILEKGSSPTVAKMLTLYGTDGTVLMQQGANSLEKKAYELAKNQKLYGITFNSHSFPGVDPYLFDGIFDGVAEPILEQSALISASSPPEEHIIELRLRQFDLLIYDAKSLHIDFLINRRQADRFERGDTIGKIRLDF